MPSAHSRPYPLQPRPYAMNAQKSETSTQKKTCSVFQWDMERFRNMEAFLLGTVPPHAAGPYAAARGAGDHALECICASLCSIPACVCRWFVVLGVRPYTRTYTNTHTHTHTHTHTVVGCSHARCDAHTCKAVLNVPRGVPHIWTRPLEYTEYTHIYVQ
jgi:hypothetical protein